MSASEQASEAEIWQRWPLHVLVWKDDPKALEALIQEKQVGNIHMYPCSLYRSNILVFENVTCATVSVTDCTLCFQHTCMQRDCEQLDPRGRTPLHLAVSLGRVRCTEILLHHGANALAVNRHQWSGISHATPFVERGRVWSCCNHRVVATAETCCDQ